MLRDLIIKNFAIIEELTIPFEKGLTVLTGETGAGKSILIEALNLLLGGRASQEIIRSDEDDAVVEGFFELSAYHKDRIGNLLEIQGMESGPELIVRRIVSRSGRNKVFINGSISTVQTLADITQGLVDISGQHEHISLLQRSRHLAILDQFADHQPLIQSYQTAYQSFRELEKKLADVRDAVSQRLHRIDYLSFQINEIDNLKPQAGEMDELQARFEKLRNLEKIVKGTRAAHFFVYDAEESAYARVSEAIETIEKIAGFDEQLDVVHKRLEEARFILEDASRELSLFEADADLSDARQLDDVQSRLEELKRLERKHGRTLEDILEGLSAMREELDMLENAEAHEKELEEKVEKARQAAIAAGIELSKSRRARAEDLCARIQEELKDLHMAGTRLVTRFAPADLAQSQPDPGPDGLESLEFLISANLGEEPRPLAKIASGGELARIMLAVKTVLSERDDVMTYIFDEVDTGVGGSTADMVGQKIRDTAQSHQVVCITHLPHIASMSDHHYVVEKSDASGRTQSIVRALDSDERVEEIARMLGGTRVTDATRLAAREMIESPTGARR